MLTALSHLVCLFIGVAVGVWLVCAFVLAARADRRIQKAIDEDVGRRE